MSRLKLMGKNICKYRENKKLSQEKLAEIVGLSREYITRIENGQKSVSLKKLFTIADALGAKICNIMNFD